MKLLDIIELAKQGYTPADIKELLAINVEGVNQDVDQGESVEVEEAESEPATPASNPTAEASEADANPIDYKKLYEDSLVKLAEAQKSNVNVAMPSQENDLDILANTIKGFM